MQSNRLIQISLILLTCGLIAFLFFNGRSNSTALVQSGKASEQGGLMAPSGSFNFSLLEKDTKAKLPVADAKRVDGLTGKQDIKSLTELASLYEKDHQPALAGYYYKQLTEKDPSNKEWWLKTGASFFDAQQTVNDSNTYSLFVNLSIQALNKTLEMDPQNLEAMTDQAINYKEGMNDPMKGVGMLRQALQIDSNYRKAIFYLGLLSIESQQLQKAEARFEKLTKLPVEKGDENYPYYFRYYGQVEMMLGKKEKALAAYQQYKNYVDMMATDPKMKADADALVKSAQ
jgi:tetratricopeptide (TPR) repeat protein